MNSQGVLLINLGSPDSTQVADVRRYLREFLMDPRVLDAPWPIRAFVVYGLILPFRPRHSAHAYSKVWTPEGAPLVVISHRVRAALEARLGLPVELAMRYRQPTAAGALGRLHARGVREAALIPLFPQYAMSSFETAVEHVSSQGRRVTPGLRIRVASPFFDDDGYIGALASSSTEILRRGHDHVLISFHGLPERHLRKSDPTHRHCLASPTCCETPSPAHATCYRAQCRRTASLLAQRMALPRWSVAFQSRLGRDPWLQPFTDVEIPRLARAGVRRLAVLCPGFVADCLETLEEIGMRGRESFEQAGGTDFTFVPCLNDHPDWIMALAGIARRALGSP